MNIEPEILRSAIRRSTALAELEHASLAYGAHDERNPGELCALEWAAYLAGEEHSDEPQCVCPVLRAFVTQWNDDLNDDDRTRLLKPLISKLIGTRSTPEVEEARAWMALDWLVRENAPAWLDLVRLAAKAAELRALAPITDATSAEAATKFLLDAKIAARDAALVAGEAARVLAWNAARAATRAAAGDAAGDVARIAAGTAARAATRDAAWAAARAGIPLRPTTEALQLSAVALLERMISVPGTWVESRA